jgi:glycyl-tRNA synthetase
LRTGLCDAYHTDTVEGEERTVLRFAQHVAPVKLAVLPLSKKLADPARKIENDLRRYFKTDYDDAGSIGKRYRRQDEAGTPFCLTYDFDSETDQKVTIRHRDSTEQERVALAQIKPYFIDKNLILG